MPKKKFRFSHSLWGGLVLLVAEWLLVRFVLATTAGEVLVCAAAALGSIGVLYIAAEIIEEVRSSRHMLALLFALVAEFVVFFAFQYAFLLGVSPKSFPALDGSALTLALHSVMVFVFNPIYLPATAAGQALLFINTLAALALVLFVLQNVWQFRTKANAILKQ